MKNKCIALILALACMFTLVSCSGGAGQTSAPGGSGEAAGSVSADLIIGTGATSATYYFVGAAIGNTVDQQSEGLSVLIQSTAGGMENINLVASGDLDIGMCNTDGIYNAYNGINTYESVGAQPIRTLMVLYPSITHLITQGDSDIQSWYDLKGKRVCLGTQGSTFVAVAQEILAMHGINWETDITPFYLTADEMGTAVNDGDIDAGFIYGGAPLVGITNACVGGDIRFVGMDDDIIEKLCEKHPYYSPATLAGNTYPGEHEDTKGFALNTCFIVNESMDEEVAYEFVKTAMENLDLYKDTNASTAAISPEVIWDSPIPLHPGAERYYREMGWME